MVDTKICSLHAQWYVEVCLNFKLWIIYRQVGLHLQYTLGLGLGLGLNYGGCLRVIFITRVTPQCSEQLKEAVTTNHASKSFSLCPTGVCYRTGVERFKL